MMKVVYMNNLWIEINHFEHLIQNNETITAVDPVLWVFYQRLTELVSTTYDFYQRLT